MRADAQDHQMKAKTSLADITLHNPVEDADEGFAGHGKCLSLVIDLTIKMGHRIIEVSIRRKMSGPDHLEPCFLTDCRSRWAVRSLFETR